MAVEIFMPKMSDHMEEGEIIQWLVQEGDSVEQGQVILELMTDKVVAELEAPAAGILKGIRAYDGARVPVGETFAFIADADEEVPTLPSPGPAETRAVAEMSPPVPTPTPELLKSDGRIRAVPAARRLAKELGIDLAQITGSGPSGRIREKDVRAFAEAQTAETPPAKKAVRATPVARRLAKEFGVDLAQVTGSGPAGRIREEDVRAFAQAPPVAEVSPTPAAPVAPVSEAGEEWLDLSPIQRLTGQRMVASTQGAPQFALAVDVDMTKAIDLREILLERIQQQTDARLSITGILVKITASTLRDFPAINASFEDGRIKLHPQVNVGVAVGTEKGLVVPVIKDAGQKTLAQITQELKAFRQKAQAMRFSQEDLSGGTFTLSNLGMYGIDRFRAIINPPESAILAVGQIVKKPVGRPDDTIALRPMMSLTLTADHRIMDGVQAARFLAEVKARIEEPYLMF